MLGQSLIYRRRVSAACLLLLVLVSACGSGKTKEEYLASGDQFFKDGKVPEAIVEYRNAIAIDPQFGRARAQLAESYIKQNDLQRAMAESIRAADLLPDDEKQQMQAARFLLLARRFEDAKTRADNVLAKNPKHVDATIARATALAGLKDMQSAIAEVEEAIRIDPQNARSHMMLGAMQVSVQKVAEAEAAFKRAIEVAPDSLEAQQAMASFYWAANRLPETEEWLRKAVST